MNARWIGLFALVSLGLWPGLFPLTAAELALRRIREATEPSQTTIRPRLHQRSPYAIPREITAKFAEHLGWNIYNGMDAQILRNATFAEYPFWTGQMTPDGVTKFHVEESRITSELRRQAIRFGWPESELDELARARADALASFWTRLGGAAEVQVSPDTGPHGGRAQRVAVSGSGQGIAQWTWLPLHRERQYSFELMARSPDLKQLSVSFWRAGSDKPIAAVRVEGLADHWQKLRGRITLPDDQPDSVSYKFAITADMAGEWVIRHAFLHPSDHIGGADPEVVRLLRDSRLPLLRWPGGNFVSAYHWEDGIGPVEQRPTRPNYAWGAVEPNTFGTAEFIAFCRAVGAEPMICVNAGSGSAKEAARWIEYCNGSADSPMGRLRAAHGHPEPFEVKHWEVGNELWGRWQMRWTTASGYVDRYHQFRKAMLASDPTITLYSCGAPVLWGKDWNDTLIAGAGASMGIITDHPLIGGHVPLTTDPLDVYRDFMAVPEVLEQKWSALRAAMRAGGVESPKLAVTELQLFAHLGQHEDTNAPVRLTRETLPGQGSMTEAIYDILIYHAAIRLAPFVTMITHSATVNHGGGLRKERERVWAHPCHYAQEAFAALAEATPVGVEIETALEQAPLVLPDLKKAGNPAQFGVIDALAAIGKDGALLLSIVHRGSAGPIQLTLDLQEFEHGGPAELRTLTAPTFFASNSRETPAAIQPADSLAKVEHGKVQLNVSPFTVLRMRIPPQAAD